MPVLNKIRLTHIVYNERHNLIRDLVLNLDGVTTLLNLENGGGKTVINQLCHAPYLSGRERSFGVRKFNELFQDGLPSFVVHEWTMDQNAGRFLVGLMLVKRPPQPGQEEGSERLLELAFIDEFDADYSGSPIEELVLSEASRPLRTSQAQNILNAMAGDKKRRFRVYNLSNSMHKSQYNQRLAELGISIAQWKQMRTFNQEESGITKFTELYPTESRLLNDMFIPAVEAKINTINQAQGRHGTIMELITDNIKKYAANLDEYQADLKAYDTYQNYLDFLSQAKAASDEVAQALDVVCRQQDILQGLHLGIVLRQQADAQQASHLKTQIQEEQTRKTDLLAQEISSRWHHQKTRQLKNKTELESAQAQRQDLQEQLRIVKHKINLYTCADYYTRLKETETKIDALRTRIQAARMEQAQALRQMEAFGAALYICTSQKSEEAAEKAANLETRKEEVQALLEKLEEEANVLQAQYRHTLEEVMSLRQILQTYDQREAEFTQTYGIPLPHRMEPYTHKDSLEKVRIRLEKELKKLDTSRKAARQMLEDENQQLEELRNQRSNLKENIGHLKAQAQQADKVLKANEKECSQREHIALFLGAGKEALWDSPLLHEMLADRKKSVDASMETLQEQIFSTQRQIDNLNTGTSLEVDEQVRQIASSQGTELQFASSWLREGGMDKTLAQTYISRFPLLPYSLIMSRNQKAALCAALEKENIYTSAILPILEREQLDAIVQGQSPISLDDFFYAHYNTELLDTEALNRRTAALQQDAVHYKNNLDRAREERERLQAFSLFLQNCISKDQYEKDLEKAASLEKRLKKSLLQENDLSSSIQQLEVSRKEHEQEIQTCSQKITEKDQILKTLIPLQKALDNARKTSQKLAGVSIELNRLEQSRQENEAAEKKAHKEAQDLSIAITDQSHILKNCRNHQARYASYKDIPTQEEGDLDWLESQFEVFEKDPSHSNVVELDKSLVSTQKEQAQYKNDLEEELEQTGLQETDVKSILFDSQKLRAFKKQREILDQNLAQCLNNINQLDIKDTRYTERLHAIQNELQEKTGREHILETDSITICDWKNEILQLDTSIQNRLNQVQALEKMADSLDSESVRIQDRLANVSFEKRIITPANLDTITLSSLRHTITLNLNQLSLDADARNQTIARSKQVLENYIHVLPAGFENLQETTASLRDALPDPSMFAGILEHSKTIVEENIKRIQSSRDKIMRLKDEAVMHIYDHVLQIHEQINRIDSNISIENGQSRMRMLEITLPKLEEEEEGHKTSIHQFVDEAARQLIDNHHNESLVWKLVTPQNLFALLVPASQIGIRVRKVEAWRTPMISWNQVGKLSGAESFLSAMTIMLAVLYYQRSDATMGITGKVQPSTIFMDNPFAYVQSDHILDALLKLLNQTRMQMIALSKVENAGIIKAIPNIYFLQLQPHADQKQHLIAEHKKSVVMDSIHLHTTEEKLMSEEAYEDFKISLFD